MRLILRILLILSFAVSAFAQDIAKFKVPALTGPVMDQAGVISGPQAQKLEALLRAANEQAHVQMTILTLPTLNGMPIEQASIEITDKWQLGKKGEDKGILFLIVPSEKHVRLEVGRGLEGDLPDVYAKRILADIARPYFKQGQYGDGILAATLATLKIVAPQVLGQGDQAPPAAANSDDDGGMNIWLLILIFALVFGGRMFFPLFFGGFGGGFGGGGFGGGSGGGWSGGGGGFGGGGSSDSW